VTTVVIVDDDLLVCEHLDERLSRDADLECVGIANGPAEARALVRERQPDLIVLDIILGEARDPIGLAAELVSLSPHSRIIICTVWSDRPGLDGEQEFLQKVRASHSGVVDWVSKGRGIEGIITRLRQAAQWQPSSGRPSPLEEALGTYLRGAASAFEEFPFRNDDAELTPAEARIAVAVARGLEADMTVEDVAKTTGFTPGTVRGHLKNIYAKWQVHTLAGFVAEARRRGLLDG
jgi:DNA-binding NarL/FixJ family response regulator